MRRYAGDLRLLYAAVVQLSRLHEATDVAVAIPTLLISSFYGTSWLPLADRPEAAFVITATVATS
ncbi:MAG: hypothetical protein ACK4SY_03910 [Pyrobaculum sp.]